MKIIYTRKGEEILVDDEDFAAMSAFAWRLTDKGYAQRAVVVRGKKIHTTMHRQILGLTSDDKRFVDHVNGNRTDNRRCNLRVCTRSQNGYNQGLPKHNTSGFKGVCLRNGRWIAGIKSNGKKKHLGSFETPEAAYAAYCSAARELHGEFANLGAASDSADKEPS